MKKFNHFALSLDFLTSALLSLGLAYPLLGSALCTAGFGWPLIDLHLLHDNNLLSCDNPHCPRQPLTC